MKLLLLAASLASASALTAPSCAECNEAAAGLRPHRALLRRVQRGRRRPPRQAHLRGVHRGAEGHPHRLRLADGRAACEEALGTYWGDMANCLFPAFIGASDACEQLGLCRRSPRTLLGDWTCDDCTSIMTRVADFMVDPATIAEGVGILQGECFCANGSHTEECPGLVEGLAAPAMMVLSEVLKETTPELCQDIVGVC